MEGVQSGSGGGSGGNGALPSQEKVLADFVALISSGDKTKEGALQQKLQEIMKSGGMTHETMFKKLQAIQTEQHRNKAAANPKQQQAPQPAPTSAPPQSQSGGGGGGGSHPAFKSGVDESPFLASSSADASAYPISASLSLSTPSSSSGNNPAIYASSRPSLTGGYTTGRISGTPAQAQLAREEPPPLVFTADHRTQPRANKNAAGDLSMRRTIHDLVASVDPNVKIEPEVEDLLLSIADEFIDSVTNFSCRLAKHRGGDTLEVRDLQLHLERNHNIRIPGFASDDTRISLSQASSAILPPAPATGGGGGGGKKGGGAGGGTHMTLRSQRLAQVQQAKRDGKLV